MQNRKHTLYAVTEHGVAAMTLPKFLAKLAETPRDWRADPGLRRHDGKSLLPPQCPITAVAACAAAGRQEYPLEQWEDAAADLGLSPELAHQIVIVADSDGLTYPPDARLRAALLTACGLPLPQP